MRPSSEPGGASEMKVLNWDKWRYWYLHGTQREDRNTNWT